jgi:small redox-active disulfide protein 2
LEEKNMDIKILGPGCANCQKLNALAHEAASELGIDAQFEKVTDMAAIAQYAILHTPGLVVNGEVVVSGRIPTKPEIRTWLSEATPD